MCPFLLTSSDVKLIKNDATNIIIYTILSTLNFPTCRVDYIIKILKIIRDLWGKDEIGEILDKISEGRALMEGLKLAIDEDTDAFNKVMRAFKMPKANDEEKKARSLAIQEAMKEAAKLPYETAKNSIKVMDLGLFMLEHGNKNAASDAAVACLMGYAALNGALYNVKINLNSIKDDEFVAQMTQEIKELEIQGDVLLEKAKDMANNYIG